MRGALRLPIAQEGAPQAYVHFRWEEEEGVPVLYCYEIQLEAAVQRKGLGKCVHQPCLICMPLFLQALCTEGPHAAPAMEACGLMCDIMALACSVPDRYMLFRLSGA